jgi:hypothetical protein
MDIKYFFENSAFLYSNEIQVWAGWIGKYTIGDVSCRGTRLWFRTNAAKSFDSGLLYNDDFYDKLDKAEDNFPGDNCNLRADKLELILDELENKVVIPEICKYYENTLEELIKELWSDNIDLGLLFEKEKTIYPILIDLNPTKKVWFIYKQNEIIQELTEVLKVLQNNKVTWVWV